jgi:hypothetical protein
MQHPTNSGCQVFFKFAAYNTLHLLFSDIPELIKIDFNHELEEKH